MNFNTKLNKCPLCGRAVHLELKTSTVGSTTHNCEPCPCVNRSAKITCDCGLSLEREWIQIQTKDGYVLRDEDIFTVWNRLSGAKEAFEKLKKLIATLNTPKAKTIPDTMDIDTLRKDAVKLLRTECIGDSEFMELAKHMGADALALQIPKRVEKTFLPLFGEIPGYTGKCPSCNAPHQIFVKLPYIKTDVSLCNKCGQTLDWSDANENDK